MSGVIPKVMSPLQRGAIIIEAMVIIPFLIFLFMAVVDVTCLIIAYSDLEQAVREGIRVASRTPDLEEAPDPGGYEDSEENAKYCSSGGASDGSRRCAHIAVKRRVRYILVVRSAWGVSWDDEYATAIVSSLDRASDRVFVEASAIYGGFFGSYSVAAFSQGPYLY